MSDRVPLVRTKLYRPTVSDGLLVRERLHEAMDARPQAPLTLVSAPAGYGKSVLVGCWVESLAEPSAWLSLDAEDSDLAVFVRYLLAAVRTVFPDACPETGTLLASPNPVPLSVLGRCLVNELDDLGAAWVLVLDDYHQIDPTSEVHELLRFLLSHPARGLKLVIAARSDPPLGIASLRGRGMVVEVRQKDLRFTPAEISEYLRRGFAPDVGPKAIRNLERQTEGWAVGLRLVCLTISDQEDPERILSGLTGGSSSIREYLVEEVLKRQPEKFQRALLETSLLDRFSGPLCTALCGIDGDEFLRYLETANLFVIRLDGQGTWQRYHHLFQELLEGLLERRASAEEISALHGRACDWFEENDLIGEALQHALRAGDVERAARLVEANRIDLLDNDQWYVLEERLRLLPSEVRDEHPGLLLAEAWSAYERFQFDRLAAVLDRVEKHLDPGAAPPSWAGELHLLKGEILYWSGEGESSRRTFETARKLLPDRHGLVTGLLALQYGLALCMAGRRERAIESLDARIRETGAREGVYLSRLVAGLYFVHHLSGNLVGAAAEARRLHSVANRSEIAYTEAWSNYMQACAHLHAGDLGEALMHFGVAAQQRYILHARGAVDSLAGLALTQQLIGRESAASESLDQLLDFALELGDTQYLSVARSCRARVALLRGEPASAIKWARSVREAPTPAGLFMWLEVPALTRARALVAEGSEGSTSEALDVLSEIRHLSEACRFVNQSIEVAVLTALAHEKRGQAGPALQSLEEALGMAAPGGWTRPFLEAGKPLADLLAGLPKRDVHAAFLAEIGSSAVPAPAAPRAEPPLGRLTDREQDVLELLAERLLYKEIAARLFISPQTVNSHLKNVYSKLHVGNRHQAVARARELGILPPA